MATIKRHGSDVSDKYSPTEYGQISLDERANDGETGQGTMPIPDPAGTTAVYSGQSLEVLVGATSVFKGFVGSRTRDRSDAANGTRLVNSHAAIDQNARLTGFRSGKVSRPSETDVARMTWFFTTYLSDLDQTWILSTNAKTVAAKQYNTDGLWQELLGDLQTVTGKTGFIEGGRAHWHLPTEGIATGKAISDVDADWGSDCYQILPGVKFSSDPMELTTDIRVEDANGNSSTATDSTSASEHDADGVLHQRLIQTSDTTTSLATQAATYLAANKDEKLTYECDIGPLTAADVVAMPVGSLITVTSFVMGLSAATQRIAERVITIRHHDRFFLHLFLSWPIRRNLGGRGTISPGFPTPSGAPTSPMLFDIAQQPPHFTASNPGDPTKRMYFYLTAGGPTDPIVSDGLTQDGSIPPANATISADSTAGDGTGILAGTTTFNRKFPYGTGSAGLEYDFVPGVPVTFNVYATYYAAGGTAYTIGSTFLRAFIHGTTTPVPGLVQLVNATGPTTCGVNGTILIGSITLTYYPGGRTDPIIKKGDLIAGDALATPTRVAATGTAGNVLTEDPTTATGWKSAPPKSARTVPFFGC